MFQPWSLATLQIQGQQSWSMVTKYFMQFKSTGTSFPFSLAAASQMGKPDVNKSCTGYDSIDALDLKSLSAGSDGVGSSDSEQSDDQEGEELHQLDFNYNK
jgi:hypothetical protein